MTGFRITDYFWDTGTGFMPGGQKFSTMFTKPGEYTVQLGLLGAGDSVGFIPRACVIKKVRIYDSFQEMTFKGSKDENKYYEQPVTDSAEIQTTQIKAYLMNDLSSRQKAAIKESLKGPFKLTVRFDQSGILKESYTFLDAVSDVMKKNQDLRIDIAVYSQKDKLSSVRTKISDQWARYLGFFYKNEGIDPDLYQCTGFGSSDSVFNPDLYENKAVDGEIEFVFLKK
jgi:hypothetical protein